MDGKLGSMRASYQKASTFRVLLCFLMGGGKPGHVFINITVKFLIQEICHQEKQS